MVGYILSTKLNQYINNQHLSWDISPGDMCQSKCISQQASYLEEENSSYDGGRGAGKGIFREAVLATVKESISYKICFMVSRSFLDSMLPQYMALCVCQCVSQKKIIGHF